MTSIINLRISRKMEVSEPQIENIATLNEKIEEPTTNAQIDPAPAADATDTYVTHFKKDNRKKEIQIDDAEFANAKAYLSTKISGDSVSVYDHLTNLVSHLLETKPANAFGNSHEI